MEGGRGARRPAALSSSTGSSWASFEEKAKDYGTRAVMRGGKAGREGGKGVLEREKVQCGSGLQGYVLCLCVRGGL